MPENMNFVQSTNNENRGCGCDCNCGCSNNNGFLANICGGDSEILFFIIIFLLLFTNFGCGCCKG